MFSDKLNQSIAEAAKKVMDEELKGQQHKLDVNKNNKVDAEDFKHLRAGKKPVEEGIEAFGLRATDAQRKKAKEDGAKFVADTLAKRKKPDSTSSKQAVATLRNEEQEQIQEYQSKDGVYRHKGTYGTEKSVEAGYTDYDKENELSKSMKTKAPRKLGARQNFVRSKRVNEGFSAMLNAYNEGGIKGLFESMIKEEPTNDEFKKELDKAQAKSEGKEKAEVAKSAVQAVRNEETEQLDELSPGTLKSYVKGAKSEVRDAEEVRDSARAAGDGKTANDMYQLTKKRNAGIKQAKAKLNAEETEIEVLDYNDVNGVKEASFDLEEKTLTEPESKKKEEVVKSMKKGMQGFKDRYGSDAKSVMYATATKIAKDKA
jgi:hypothetical protein